VKKTKKGISKKSGKVLKSDIIDIIVKEIEKIEKAHSVKIKFNIDEIKM